MFHKVMKLLTQALQSPPKEYVWEFVSLKMHYSNSITSNFHLHRGGSARWLATLHKNHEAKFHKTWWTICKWISHCIFKQIWITFLKNWQSNVLPMRLCSCLGFVCINVHWVPLWLELFHDVKKLVIYARVIRKTNFDLVQIWQGIFNLNIEKEKRKKKKTISTEQSTGTLSWMYGAAFSPGPSYVVHGV